MNQIKGKNALITGAASGIGRALALRLAQEGANVYLVDLDEEALIRTVKEARALGVIAFGQQCDVSRPSEISECTRDVLSKWGDLDILVNNAGVCYYGPTTKMSGSQWDWVLAVNLMAPIQFVRELLPTLLARPEAHVVNVASLFGLIATGHCCAYHVSKFGLVGFTEALRAEFGRQGLGVTAVCPGFVSTNLFSAMACDQEKRRKQPPRWLTVSPEKIAEKTVRAIYRDKRLVLGSTMAQLLHGAKRFVPGLLDWLPRIGRRRKIREKWKAWEAANSQASTPEKDAA